MLDTPSSQPSSHYSLIQQAFTDSLPILAAYFPIGIVWGVLWEQAGLPPIWGVVLSTCVFAGALQFVALSLIAAKASFWGMFVTGIPIAIRNSFYTMTALQRLPRHWLCRLYSTFGLVDATFAILMGKPIEQARNPWYNLSLTIIIQLYWVAGTAVGVYCGGYIPDGIASLDFALPALLAVLALEQYRKVGGWRLIAVPTLAASASWLVLGHGWLVPALIICTAATVLKSDKETS